MINKNRSKNPQAEKKEEALWQSDQNQRRIRAQKSILSFVTRLCNVRDKQSNQVVNKNDEPRYSMQAEGVLTPGKEIINQGRIPLVLNFSLCDSSQVSTPRSTAVITCGKCQSSPSPAFITIPSSESESPGPQPGFECAKPCPQSPASPTE